MHSTEYTKDGSLFSKIDTRISQTKCLFSITALSMQSCRSYRGLFL